MNNGRNFKRLCAYLLISLLVFATLTSFVSAGEDKKDKDKKHDETPTPEVSISPEPTITPSPTPESTETPTPSPEITESATPTPSYSPDPTPSPIAQPTPVPTGSITVCKIVYGDVLPEDASTQFTINSFIPSITSVQIAAGTFGNSVFTLPLNLNEDILSDIPGNDAECLIHGNLVLGGYHYEDETIDGSGDWNPPLVNDGFTHMVNTLADFFNWNGILYDGDASNDLTRNENSDGHIILTEERPDRILVFLNEINQPAPTASPSATPEPEEGGVGGDIPDSTPTPSPTPVGVGGALSAPSGGGGGGVGPFITATPIPSISPAVAGGGIGGGMEELPETGITQVFSTLIAIFVSMVIAGIIMVLAGNSKDHKVK